MTRVYTNAVNLHDNTYYECSTITSVDLMQTPWNNNCMWGAFENCYNLRSVTNINSNVTNMTAAFMNCINLESAPTLPTNLTTLDSTFYGCAKITTPPVIPANVTNMYSAFMYCNSLDTAPTIPQGVTELNQAFAYTNFSMSPSLPTNIQHLAYTFSYCNRLVVVLSLPSNVVDLEGTFEGCKLLTAPPDIPESAIDLTYTFYNCPSLIRAPSIPKNVQYLDETFAGCTLLSGDVYIYTDKIDDHAVRINTFANTSRQKYVHIPPVCYNNTQVQSPTYNAFINAGYDTNGTKDGVYLIYEYYPALDSDWIYTETSLNNITLQEYIGTNTTVITPHNDFYSNKTLLRTGYFNNPTVETVYLNDITWVDNNAASAFYGCSNLVSVEGFNSAITNLHMGFWECRKLENIPVLPESLDSFVGGFYNCHSLTVGATIPNTVSNMYMVYSNCRNITDIPSLPSSATDYTYAFKGCKSLVNVPDIPEAAINLSEAFDTCTNLVTPPHIGNNVTNMYYTFYGCSNLTTAPVIPNSVTCLEGTFCDCTNLSTIPTLPDSIQSLSDTFDGCELLTTVPDIPANVTDLSYTFAGCTNITGIVNILGTEVENAEDIFGGTDLEKRVYIPYTYENGVYTKTYNAFVNAGYNEWGDKDGLYLRDIAGCKFQIVQNPVDAYVGMLDTSIGIQADLSQFVYTNINDDIEIQSLVTNPGTNIVVPSRYVATNTISVQENTTVEYIVRKEGYNTVEDSILITEPTRLNVDLEVIMCTFTVKSIQEGLTIVLTASGYTQQGSSITVPYGTEVSYTVSKEHYVTQTGTVTVKSSFNKVINLEIEKYDVTINPTPSDAIVEIYVNGELINGLMDDWTFTLKNTNRDIELQDYISSNTQVTLPQAFDTVNTVTVPYNTELTYVVSKEGYRPQTDTITVTEDTTITVTLSEYQRAVNVEDYTYTLNDDLYLTKYTGTKTEVDTPTIELI